jgi:hypothetical protein
MALRGQNWLLVLGVDAVCDCYRSDALKEYDPFVVFELCRDPASF